MSNEAVKVSIVMPCLNEEKTLGICLEKAKKGLSSIDGGGEIVVVDNGCTDKSADIAKSAGARVVEESQKGYGSSLRRGIGEARGKYVVMGDADDTYDFSQIKPFIEKLDKGNDLVMGSRLKGDIKPGAMPFLHRVIGNPALTFILNLFFKGKISDAHCGLRAFRKEAIEGLNLHSNGMEFASEMIIKSLQYDLKIDETPIEYKPSPVERKPHLRTFRDGWRHLRFMLIFSPYFLFIVPGLAFFIFGLVFLFLSSLGISLFNIPLGLSCMIFSFAAIFLGIQFIFLGISSKVIGYHQRFIPKGEVVKFIESKFTLEKGLILGGIIFLSGLVLLIFVVYRLMNLPVYGGSVNIGLTKLAIISSALLLIGVQLMASAFHLGFLDMKSTLE